MVDNNQPAPDTDPDTGPKVGDGGGESLAALVAAEFVGAGGDLPATERRHVDRLIRRAVEDPDLAAPEFVRLFMETARRLRDSGGSMWAGMPWMPRTYCSDRTIAFVVEAMAPATNGTAPADPPVPPLLTLADLEALTCWTDEDRERMRHDFDSDVSMGPDKALHHWRQRAKILRRAR